MLLLKIIEETLKKFKGYKRKGVKKKKMIGEEEEKALKSQLFTDIISGKGGGCIFLLHGNPGVGKTLTAEAVSEHLHIPLYMVTVGELGVTPDVLEKNLQNILELAGIWGSAILLDEADIFLEKRSKKRHFKKCYGWCIFTPSRISQWSIISYNKQTFLSR